MEDQNNAPLRSWLTTFKKPSASVSNPRNDPAWQFLSVSTWHHSQAIASLRNSIPVQRPGPSITPGAVTIPASCNKGQQLVTAICVGANVK